MKTKITNRTAAFQGIRIIALLCVLLSHSGGINIPLGIPMSLFFVVSGFLYRDNGEAYLKYIRAKFIKIFPIFWLTFIVDFFLNQRAFSLDMIPHLLLLQTYYPMPEISYDFVPFYYEYLGVSWFISCLFFCYILSPLIYRFIEGVRKEVQILLLVALITIECVYLSIDIPVEYQKWFFYVSPYYRLLEYMMGMILARILTNTPPVNHSLSNLLGEVVVMAYMAMWWIWDFGMCCTLPNLFVVGFLYLFNSPVMTKLLGNRYMIFVSAYDMPVYLLHESIMEFVRMHGGGWIWCMIWAFIICVPYAMLTNYILRNLNAIEK